MRKKSTSFGSPVNAVNTVEAVMRGLRPSHSVAVEVGASLVISALFLAFFL